MGPALWLKAIEYIKEFCLSIPNVCVCVHAQLCPGLCNLTDSPWGSSVEGIFPSRILEWVAISSSRGSSQLKHWTCVSCVSWIGRYIPYHWASLETLHKGYPKIKRKKKIKIKRKKIPRKKKFFFPFIVCTGSLCMDRLSLVAANGGYTSLRGTGFSLQGFSLLWSTGSRVHRLQYLQHVGLVAPQHVEPSQTRDRIHVPCPGRWIPNYWTTREVINHFFLIL